MVKLNIIIHYLMQLSSSPSSHRLSGLGLFTKVLALTAFMGFNKLSAQNSPAAADSSSDQKPLSGVALSEKRAEEIYNFITDSGIQLPYAFSIADTIDGERKSYSIIINPDGISIVALPLTPLAPGSLPPSAWKKVENELGIGTSSKEPTLVAK